MADETIDRDGSSGGISRRRLLQLATVAGAALVVPIRFAPGVRATMSPQTPLPGGSIPQFVDPLPALHTIAAGTDQIELRMTEFRSTVMPSTWRPALGTYDGTYVWGYREPGQGGSAPYIGPVIVATRHVPTEVKFTNVLPYGSTTNVLAYRYSTDQTVHWADPLGGEENLFSDLVYPAAFGSAAAQNYAGPVPAVVHQHGGEVPPELDGGPDAWFTSDGQYVGHAYYSFDGTDAKNYAIYRYPNAHQAAPTPRTTRSTAIPTRTRRHRAGSTTTRSARPG